MVGRDKIRYIGVVDKKRVVTNGLAVAGVVLIWFPIIALILLFDFLIPAELFHFAFMGAVLLFWAARRARSQQQKLIGLGLVIAGGFFVGGQILAMITGLDSRGEDPTGWPLILVMVSLIIYTLAIVGIGVGGILLIKDLFGDYKKSEVKYSLEYETRPKRRTNKHTGQASKQA
jgi:hypothetical protein